MPRKEIQHQLRIRKFVRTNIEIRTSSEHTPVTANETPPNETHITIELPAASEKPTPVLIKQHPNNIPLFMETLFKAKEYDPL